MAIGSFSSFPVREDARSDNRAGAAFGGAALHARDSADRTGLRVYLAVLLLSVGRFS